MRNDYQFIIKLKTALELMLKDVNKKLDKLYKQQWTNEGISEIQFEYMCSLNGEKQVIIKVLAMLEQHY